MGDTSDNAKESLAKILDLIPEVGYDVVCRILPGFASICTFCYLAKIVVQPQWHYVILVVVLSFILSLTVECFTMFPPIIWARIYLGWKAFSRFASSERVKQIESCFVFQKKHLTRNRKRALEIMRFYFREHNPSGLPLLTKVLAEEVLMLNLSIALPLCCVAAWGYLGHIPGRINWFLLMVTEILLVIAAVVRIERTVARTYFWFQKEDWHAMIEQNRYSSKEDKRRPQRTGKPNTGTKKVTEKKTKETTTTAAKKNAKKKTKKEKASKRTSIKKE